MTMVIRRVTGPNADMAERRRGSFAVGALCEALLSKLLSGEITTSKAEA